MPRLAARAGGRCRTGLRGALLLESGLAVEGCGFGAEGVRVGEVVFSTSMTGYPESLTDPSYRGQILVYTHPMVGNYGVPRPRVRHGVLYGLESERVHVEGFVVAELSRHAPRPGRLGLHEWLRAQGVPGVFRVDTRMLVRHLRSRGTMMGAVGVYPEGEPAPWDELEAALEAAPGYGVVDYTKQVTPAGPVAHEPPGAWARVSMLDCGVKHGILRRLTSLGLAVTRYPCSTPPEELVDGYQGVVVSNGPGNPALLAREAETVAALVEYGVPLLGVCLGMHLVALGLGAETYKLPYGHRGPNKPVVEAGGGRCYITTQNHGYAVRRESLEGTGLRVWFYNPDDGSLEGLLHESKPVLATQFHPEAGPGPYDTFWVFEAFARMVRRHAQG
ncbi:MAG: glutamine-hydrolyzing carbamoyl-phosphate synthase small subunit [Desulfurococcales archaeon]|nr:glutamine-hydrolyzing carbamoyl-phosphate synthase small subunit [Desulfurococcales archaeon]